jgi:hypothetical protein
MQGGACKCVPLKLDKMIEMPAKTKGVAGVLRITKKVPGNPCKCRTPTL